MHGGSDKEETEPRYYGLQLGTVHDDKDPKGLGRVRVIVPGIIDEPGPWAHPLTIGGGSPQRGLFAVPPKGSDVGIFFHGGDPERPYYLGGHWGEPAAGVELPTDVKEADAEDRAKVMSFETESWKMTFDDRPSDAKLRMMHKKMNLIVDIDAAKGLVEIQSESALRLKSAGSIVLDAPSISIGGRTVMKNGKPIS